MTEAERIEALEAKCALMGAALKRADECENTQQLVARIKRSSKYAYQAPKGGWFDVRVVPDMGYGLRGNNNNYRFADVVFGIRLDDGTIVELVSGKRG